MSAKKIPPDVEPELLARAGRGESGDQIAAWLDETHDIKMSGRRVRAFLETVRREREPIARAVVVKNLSKTITTDLDEMEFLANEARAILETAKAKNNLFAAIQAISVEKGIRETRIRLSGGGEGSGKNGGGSGAPQKVVFFPVEKK